MRLWRPAVTTALAAATVLAAALLGGGVTPRLARANPAAIYVINGNVAAALNGGPITWSALTAAQTPQLSAWATASDHEVTAGTPGGTTYIAVQTDGSPDPISVNGKGMTCSTDTAGANCNGAAPFSPVAIAGVQGTWAVMHIMSTGTFVSGSSVDVAQDSVVVSSGALTVVGRATNVTLTVSAAVLQQAPSAPNCTLAAAPSINSGAAYAAYTDIGANLLVGYGGNASGATWSSSNTASLVSAATNPATVANPNPVSMLQPSGAVVAAADTLCADTTPGTSTVTFASGAGELAAGVVTRIATVTISGVPANIALSASPPAIDCTGLQTSTVTAKVTDSAGNNVVDGTSVTFSVVALGTANPINATTIGGKAMSVITPLSSATAGVVVDDVSGIASAAIRVDCLPLGPPVAVAHAASGPASTTVQVTANPLLPTTMYRVDIFVNTICDVTTPGGAFVGAFNHATDTHGAFTANMLLAVPIPAGDYLYATVTGPDNVTSPFSPCTAVVPRRCVDDSVCNGYTDAQKILMGKDPFNFCQAMRADVDVDGRVDILDLSAMAAYYNALVPPAPSRLDQNFDGHINILDLSKAAGVYNQYVSACP